MTPDVGEDLLAAVTELRALFPEWRFGQLLATLVQAAGREDAGAVWDVEDDQLLAAAHRLIERNRERRGIAVAEL